MKAFDRIIRILIVPSLALFGLALVDFLLHPLAGDYSYQSPLFRAVNILILTPLNILVGLLIMRRVPGNAVGPLLIIWSGSVAINGVREEIGRLPFALFYTYNIIFGWYALFLLFLLFPDGRMIFPRLARWVYRWLMIILVTSFLTVMSMAVYETPSKAPNLFYLPALGPYANLILLVGLLGLFMPLLVLALVSLAVRYRHGTPVERQQIKWLSLYGSTIILYSVVALIGIPLATGGTVMDTGPGLYGILFHLLTGLFPPLVIGIAVLRYHLWGIDVIIRRTLVYAILSVILSAVYYGSVVVLQEGAQYVIGHPTPIVTVLSTLGIAALFSPLRRWIQERVDRRFYRRKYNAEKVLGGFSAALRSEMDLNNLTGSIQQVVMETMQPERVSLWLRDVPAKARGSETGQ